MTSDMAQDQGYCIFCSSPIPLNVAEPTCEAHRETWEQLDARESANYCHKCGRRNLKGYCRHDPCCEKCDTQMKMPVQDTNRGQ